jgi:methylated-DNA-[protein]-cysteine S-methyltransferase
MSTQVAWRYVVFPTDLGWMAIAGQGDRVSRLTFGNANSTAAKRALGELPRGALRDDVWFGDLVERLQAYALGARDDFRDVPISVDELTEFGLQVVERCRRIPPGATLTYGQLATSVGHQRAARAVGNVMRTNRIPLIVPCHRVVGSGGKMHGYSAAGGLETKRRLLDMEVAGWVWDGVRSTIVTT